MSQPQIFQLSASALVDTHIDSSQAMIAQAATLADSGHAAVLGCGQCAEIPLRQLGARFKRIDLIDLDGSALQAFEARSRLWAEIDGTFTFHHVDLTGAYSLPQRLARDAVMQGMAAYRNEILRRSVSLEGRTELFLHKFYGGVAGEQVRRGVRDLLLRGITSVADGEEFLSATLTEIAKAGFDGGL